MRPYHQSPKQVAILRCRGFVPWLLWVRFFFRIDVGDTVDGNQKSGINSPVEVGSLSHYLQGFRHPQVVNAGLLIISC